MMRLHNSSIVVIVGFVIVIVIIVVVVVNRHLLNIHIGMQWNESNGHCYASVLLLLLINYESMAENWFCSSQATSKCKLHSCTSTHLQWELIGTRRVNKRMRMKEIAHERMKQWKELEDLQRPISTNCIRLKNDA